jgi:2-dehydro-3-deoxyphosphogluconate aldolase/(4S)-4-hydroxy-2-oxoglutarate aldolase
MDDGTRDAVLGTAAVIPVIVVDRPEDAVPLARALVGGGLPVLEVTLRTAAAPAAIGRIAAEVPAAVVGAGTVRTPADVTAATKAGARFLVSPGTTADLLAALRDAPVPALPGVTTPSEALTAVAAGFTELKFFPAEAVGGVRWLRAVHGPVPEARFCATGGITEATAPSYLSLPNVPAVGGSWMLPPEAVESRDWPRITELAARAAALGR